MSVINYAVVSICKVFCTLMDEVKLQYYKWCSSDCIIPSQQLCVHRVYVMQIDEQMDPTNTQHCHCHQKQDGVRLETTVTHTLPVYDS